MHRAVSRRTMRSKPSGDALLTRQATALLALAREDMMVMARSQAAERKRVAGRLASRNEQCWEGLADRLSEKLRELGVLLPRRDLALLGDLNLMDYRLQATAALIEGLAEVPAAPKQWKAFCDLVARLSAQVREIQGIAKRIEAPLDRLLTAAHSVRRPPDHLRRSVGEFHHRLKATLVLRKSTEVWIGDLRVQRPGPSSRKPYELVRSIAQGATKELAVERLRKALAGKRCHLVGVEHLKLLSHEIKRGGVGRYLVDAALGVVAVGGCWFGAFRSVRPNRQGR